MRWQPKRGLRNWVIRTAVLIRRAGEPGGQRPDVLDQLRGFVHLEVEAYGVT